MRRLSFVALGFALAVLLAIGSTMVDWRPLGSVWQRFRPETPHQRYAGSLAEAQLAHTALATEWLTAAARALRQPTALTVPFTEEALIDPAQPVSRG